MSKKKTAKASKPALSQKEQLEIAEAQLAEAENTKNITKVKQAKKSGYNFSTTRQVIHSKYKLGVATFLKNISYTADLDTRPFEHTHMFHSVTESGEDQFTSAPSCGHFHVLEVVTPATDDAPATYKCSEPMQKIRKKDAYGNWREEIVPLNDYDHHRHEVIYLRSEMHKSREINEDFLKAMSTVKVPSFKDVEDAAANDK